MTVNFVAQMGLFPQNYGKQVEYFNRLRLLLQQVNTFVTDNSGLPVTLSQSAEPSQAQWEAAWVTQTGLSLPISPGASLHWWHSSSSSYGGLYGTVEGDTTVYRRDHLYPRGGTVVFETDYKTDQVASLTYAIGTNLTDHPSVSFTLPVEADLILDYSLFSVLASGSGSWGIDFLLNGNKVGTQYLSLPPDQGIQNAMETGYMRCVFPVSAVPAGNYTVQAAFGITASPASPPSVTIGGISGSGSYGARLLTVRGIIR